MTGLVANIQRYSLHDGGGIRTVAFLKGCPFHCPWCCNPETLSFKPQIAFHKDKCIHCSTFEPGARLCNTSPDDCPTMAKEVVGTLMTEEELTDKLLRDRVFFEESGGGVTLSGGECMAAPNQEFAIRVLTSCHEAGVHTAIESTLAVQLREPERLAACVDVFLIDFKIANRLDSKEIIGFDPLLRDQNVRALLDLGANVVARMPIIPGYTDSDENVIQNIERIASLGIKRADVLPFHQFGSSKYEANGMTYDLADVPQLTDNDVKWICMACQLAGVDGRVGGM